MSLRCKIQSAVMLLLGALISNDVSALSCAPLEEIYYFDCSADQCRPLFRASQVPDEEPMRPCDRHFEISDVPERLLPLLQGQLEMRPDRASGVFEIVLGEALQQESTDSPGALQEYLAASVIRLERVDESPDVVRANWESRVAQEVRERRTRMIVAWATFVGLLAVLVISARVVWRQISRSGKRSAVASRLAVGAQILVFLASAVAAMALGPFFIILLAPLTVLLWLAELCAVVWFAVRRRWGARPA